ncbi:MAG TPA: peptidoglycan-binding protein [Thiotrichaceae bacterium]|nr:peptidoglycan-binding protein [Thiotrichaceae bacterium]
MPNFTLIFNIRRETLIILLFFSIIASCTTTHHAETASFTPVVNQQVMPLQMTDQETKTVEQPISSSNLEWAQNSLDLLGYEVGDINQGLTPESQSALADFQKQSGLPETGTLTRATFQALEQAVQNLSIQPRQKRETVHLRPPVALERLSEPTTIVIPNPAPPPPTTTFTDIQTMGIYRVAAPLAEIGYFHRPLKQATFETVEMALKRFQRDIGVTQTGILDETTWSTLQGIQLSRARKAELEAATAVAQAKPSEPSPSSQVNADEFVTTDKRKTVVIESPSPPVSTMPSTKEADSAKHTLTLKTGDSVYAIDKIECQGAHEAFILFYQGELEDILKDKVQIRINKRYAMWYDTHKTGISDTDWWCIPKKRFCYSTINFTDWRGKLKANDIGDFETTLTIQSDFDITSLIAKSSKQACSF